MSTAPQPRLFTWAEANALLPTLEPLLRALQARLAELRDKRRSLGGLSGRHVGGNGHYLQQEARAEGVQEEVVRLAHEVEEGVQEVHHYGCELKDIDSGLLDFRALRDDRIVYLCWRLGEQEIAFWHEMEAGFGGRQPL